MKLISCFLNYITLKKNHTFNKETDLRSLNWSLKWGKTLKWETLNKDSTVQLCYKTFHLWYLLGAATLMLLVCTGWTSVTWIAYDCHICGRKLPIPLTLISRKPLCWIRHLVQCLQKYCVFHLCCLQYFRQWVLRTNNDKITNCSVTHTIYITGINDQTWEESLSNHTDR